VYGRQWRRWEHTDRYDSGRTRRVDQLQDVINRIRKDPYDRRLIVSAWNVAEIPEMRLPPCHMMFQFQVGRFGHLNCLMYQRSCDMFLGVPFNIASYAVMLHLIAQMTGLLPDELILTLGDVHIYHDHFDAVKEQLSREPFPLPRLWVSPDIKSLADVDVKNMLTPDDISRFVKLEDYRYHPPIKAKMAV
jgi:thymidylate synthase